MPDSAENMIALFYAVTAFAAASIGLPQLRSLILHRHTDDGLQWFRALWVLISSAFCIGTTYRALVWVDLAAFDQYWMGSINYRWPLEVVISFFVMVVALFAAGLYWRTRLEVVP